MTFVTIKHPTFPAGNAQSYIVILFYGASRIPEERIVKAKDLESPCFRDALIAECQVTTIFFIEIGNCYGWDERDTDIFLSFFGRLGRTIHFSISFNPIESIDPIRMAMCCEFLRTMKDNERATNDLSSPWGKAGCEAAADLSATDEELNYYAIQIKDKLNNDEITLDMVVDVIESYRP